MRLTETTRDTDRAADALIKALASEVSGFEEGTGAYREYVTEYARELVDDAIEAFEPMTRSEWEADQDESERADRELARSRGL
jgi:hypothetical protein